MAVPLALELGAVAKHLFQVLSSPMKSDDMRKVLQEAREKLKQDAAKEALDLEVNEAHRLRIAAIRELERERETDRRIAQAKIETLEGVLRATRAAPESPRPFTQPASLNAPLAPLLSVVIDDFLARYPRDMRSGMFKKHQGALAPLRALFGDKPIDTLKQGDLVDFFDTIERLPARWAQKCEKRKIALRELAAEEHQETLSKKTFNDNYLGPVTLFLRSARTRWQDQGFPVTLTTEGIEFTGEDDDGKHRQRAFRRDELERLFRVALAKFRDDDEQDHKWWLPVLDFYTGARVNELCQINPITDILTSADGIDYLLITEDTEGDARLKKSVKTGVKRHVPLHPDLIAGGFLKYVEKVRKMRSKLLFPAWTPTNRRASTQAERWFRDLLREAGIRDDTVGARIVGFHAFRHTLLGMALNSNPSVDAGSITGHADPLKSAVQRDYEGELSLGNKLKVLTAINFTFNPFD